ISTAISGSSMEWVIDRHEDIYSEIHVESEKEMRPIIDSVCDQDMDLEKGALCRLYLLAQKKQDCVLVILHHAVADFHSIQVLLKLLESAYQGQDIHPSQNAHHFSAWHKAWQKSENFNAAQVFWELHHRNTNLNIPWPIVPTVNAGAFESERLECKLDSS